MHGPLERTAPGAGPERSQVARTPAAPGCVVRGVSGEPVDGETAVYILETRAQFEDLRQAAAQLAGWLVLSAAGANTASPDHAVLGTAFDLQQSALEQVHRARPSARARMHHRYLIEAATGLGAALAAARKNLETESVLIPLRAAYADLQKAAGALPGFEMVAFEQGCCAGGRTIPT
jgi:hypothetical protein